MTMRASTSSAMKADRRSPLRKLLRIRFLRFLAVGALNTVFGYAAFCLALALTGHSLAAVTLSTIAGVLFNFRSTGAIVFGSSDRRRLTRFVAVYALLFAINALALHVLERTGAAPALGQACLIPFLAMLSYALNRDFVFSNPDRSGNAA